MFRTSLKNVVLGGVVAGLTWSFAAPQADAFWHRRGGSSSSSSSSSSSGSWGSSSSSSGYWGGSSSSSSSSSGYYRGWRGGSSSSSSSSSGSSSSGGYYSSGGSWGSGGGYVVQDAVGPPSIPAPGGTVVPGNPPVITTPGAENNAPAPGTTDPLSDPTAPSSTMNQGGRTALLAVRVPADARVFVNGLATRSTGADRRFVSNGLRPGMNYTYELRAQMTRDGKPVEETKVVQLQAGQTAEVDFNGVAPEVLDERTAAKSVKTSLTLNVPADAKVFLSGNESKSTGSVRQFVTTKLNAGQSWDNYVIRVELERNGQTITKEETIKLAAGQTRELTIDVDAAQVAQATTGERQ